jgi:hypothetical protein
MKFARCEYPGMDEAHHDDQQHEEHGGCNAENRCTTYETSAD